jgi:hypothetical protein
MTLNRYKAWAMLSCFGLYDGRQRIHRRTGTSREAQANLVKPAFVDLQGSNLRSRRNHGQSPGVTMQLMHCD